MIFEQLKVRVFIFFMLGVMILPPLAHSQESPQWPEITQENKPWTRWWWMGNAVNKQGLTANLEQLKNANLGGVEITPIYGVSGYENEFINYLSPKWMDMLRFTLMKSDSLDLGVDMATGTGWPFGGPWVGVSDASKNVHFKTYQLRDGQQLEERVEYIQEPMLNAVGNSLGQLNGKSLSIEDIKKPIRNNDSLQAMALAQVRFNEKLPMQALMAYSDEGQVLNLTGKVDTNGNLDWVAPSGDWKLFAVFMGWHGKMVERAAPGGEGFVIDHFSEKAITDYLDHFSEVFSEHNISSIRAFFNDSYEVDDANGEAEWTPDFFDQFEKRRGYDLRNHLQALVGEEVSEANSRVLSDFRETISDLLLDHFTRKWHDWAHNHDAIIRNQAHGSPANILDLYAASDIPETEGTDILRAKLASSAANVTGKKLASSESATWLNDHFQSSLYDVKQAIDRYFVSGINHIFYHGSAYSPDDEQWPGWLFYAAVHFQPDNPFWDHFGAFNQYVARVQSFLQAGDPDNDILLYYPVYDRWAKPGRTLLQHFDGNVDDEFEGTTFKEAAHLMRDQGYTFDFISDRQLQNSEYESGKIETKGGGYKTLIVPGVQYLPIETLEQVIDLANKGSTVILYDGIPQSVPGMGNLNQRKESFKKLLKQLRFGDQNGIKIANVGKGKVVLGDDLNILLKQTGIHREKMIDHNLRFTRRSIGEETVYFITNWGDDPVDSWVPISKEVISAVIFDPMHGNTGYAAIRPDSDGNSEAYLQLEPGESCILKTDHSGQYRPTYNYVKKSGDSISLTGKWMVHFENGGPELPKQVNINSLKSWTTFSDETNNFSGTGQYQLSFSLSIESVDGFLLNLGEVHESANINLNGHDLGMVIGPVYQVFVPSSIIQDENTLTVEVSNSMANRISYLDRNDIKWKKFYNVNFPAHDRENVGPGGLFDASGWAPEDSGLMGPVTLTPVEKFKTE